MMNQNLKNTLDMKHKGPFRSPAFLRGLPALAALCACAAANPGGPLENSNFSDASTWMHYVAGSGLQLTPTGNGFEVDYAAGAREVANGGICASYISTFALRGDFTLDIDYALKTWPADSGIRLGLDVWPSVCMIRAGTADMGQIYSFSAGPFVNVPTSDPQGSLRLVRSGGTLLGYYRSSAGGPWILAGSRSGDPVFLQDFQVCVSSWTHDFSFGGRPVAVTLGNFVMTADTVLPGPYGIPLWKTGVPVIPSGRQSQTLAPTRWGPPPRPRPAIISQPPSQTVGPGIQALESAALPTGIVDEDLNLDLNAAIQSYQSLIIQFDAQRPLAANAIFRLAECYRRLGRTEEARSQYARILREFADQAPLVNLCRRYATRLATTPTAPLPAGGVSPGPHLPAGLVSWWAGEGNANDSTGANNGVLEGAVTFVPGKVGQAFSFDGTTADVRVPASPSLNVGAGNGMTIEAWIRPADLSAQRPVLEWNDGSYGTLLYVSVYLMGGGAGPGAFTANFKDVNHQAHNISSPPGVLTTNRFQHVAATYDGTSGDAALYLDGAIVAQANLGIFTPRTIGDLYFGLRPYDDAAGMRFVGEIDEVGVYSRALSEAEIEAIHAAGGAGKRLVPVAPSNGAATATAPLPPDGVSPGPHLADGTATLEWQLAQARNELIKARGEVAKSQALLATGKAKLQEDVTSPQAKASVSQAQAELDLGKAQEALWSQEVARLEARLKEQEAVARLKYQQAQAEFKQFQDAFNAKAVSQSQYDAARLALEKAAADYPGPAENPADDKGGGTERGIPYTVAKGDTLSAIIAAFHEKHIMVTLEQILKANPGVGPEHLRVGMKLFVPLPQPAGSSH
jgi:tetratricopeptide (TPR) repeat protein